MPHGGDRTLYGGGTQGYGHCAGDATGAITMRDGNPTSVDGDPMIDLRLGANEVVLTDVSPYTLGIEISERFDAVNIQKGVFAPIIERKF